MDIHLITIKICIVSAARTTSLDVNTSQILAYSINERHQNKNKKPQQEKKIFLVLELNQNDVLI